jgi:hypothetical protein
MSTLEERELAINPIVVTSVQHNTQVRPPIHLAHMCLDTLVPFLTLATRSSRTFEI